MTTEALSGEIVAVGKSNRTYVFGFGWSCRYNLESIYGENLKSILEDTDQARIMSNVLLSALKARAANNLPENFSRKEMYELLDDLGEEKVKQVWEVAKHSMGFLNRLLGISEEDVNALAKLALENQVVQSQSPLTGTDS